MKEYKFSFDFLPVSVNASYRSFKNRVYKSQRLKDFQKKMYDMFNSFKNVEKLEGKLSIDIVFEMKGSRKRDIDNMMKSLLDSLEGRIFENDNQIYEMNIKKFENCKADQTIISIKQIFEN